MSDKTAAEILEESVENAAKVMEGAEKTAEEIEKEKETE
jgi:Mg2+ and Co2+ transporter CorA